MMFFLHWMNCEWFNFVVIQKIPSVFSFMNWLRKKTEKKPTSSSKQTGKPEKVKSLIASYCSVISVFCWFWFIFHLFLDLDLFVWSTLQLHYNTVLYSTNLLISWYMLCTHLYTYNVEMMWRTSCSICCMLSVNMFWKKKILCSM